MAFQLLEKIKQKALDAASAVGNYFNPESNGGQNFWSASNPVSQGMVNVQKTIQPVDQKIAKVNEAVKLNSLGTSSPFVLEGTRANLPIMYKVQDFLKNLPTLTEQKYQQSTANMTPAEKLFTEPTHLMNKATAKTLSLGAKLLGHTQEQDTAIQNIVHNGTPEQKSALAKQLNDSIMMATAIGATVSPTEAGAPSAFATKFGKKPPIEADIVGEAKALGAGNTLPAPETSGVGENNLYHSTYDAIPILESGKIKAGTSITDIGGEPAVSLSRQRNFGDTIGNQYAPKLVIDREALTAGVGKPTPIKNATNLNEFEERVGKDIPIKYIKRIEYDSSRFGTPEENARLIQLAKEKNIPLVDVSTQPSVVEAGMYDTYYHGTGAKTEDLVSKGIISDKTRTGAVSVTDNPEIAKRFGNVVEVNVPKNGRILDLTSGKVEADIVRQGFPTNKWYNKTISDTGARVQSLVGFEDLSQAQKQWLANKGYVGVKIPGLEAGAKGNEIRFVGDVPKEWVAQQPLSVQPKGGSVRPPEMGQAYYVDANGTPYDVESHQIELYGKPDLRVVTTPNELNVETKTGFLPGQVKTLQKMFDNIKSKNPNAKIVADTPNGSGTFKSVDELLTQPKGVEVAPVTPTVNPPPAGGAPPPAQLPPSSNYVANKGRVANLQESQANILKQVADLPASTVKPKGAGTKLTQNLFGQVAGKGSFEGSLGIIRREGPAGEAIVDAVKTTNSQIAILAGDAKNRMRVALKDLTPEEKSSLSEVVQKQTPAISNAQQQAANAWREVALEIHSNAITTGKEIGKIEDYWPHFPSKDPNAIEAFIKDQKLTSEEAQSLRDISKGGGTFDDNFVINRDVDIKYGNLDKSRLANAPYETNPNVLFGYIDHAYKNIVHEANFGKGDQNLYKLADKTANPTQVSSIIDQILGKNQGNSVTDAIFKTARAFQTMTKLSPPSSPLNLAQTLSTVIRTDPIETAKAIQLSIADPELAISRLVKSGESDLSNFLKDYGAEGDAAAVYIKLIGMKGSEVYNRLVAVNTGYTYVEKLAQQAVGGSEAAVRELGRFGLTLDDATRGLTEDQKILAGRQVSMETQFSTAPGQLPQAWKTPAGMTITQFKSFSYKQTGFVKNAIGRVASEAGHGNFAPMAILLTTIGIAMPIAGEVVNDFKALWRNKKRVAPLISMKRYIENIVGASSLGLLDTLPGMTGQYGATGVVSSVFGPTAGDIWNSGQAIADFSSGLRNYDASKSFLDNVDPNNTTRRNILKSVPFIGGTLSNTLVPNAAVQNQTVGGVQLGVNNGLTVTDKKTYDSLVSSGNITAAEDFKKTHQYVDTSAEKKTNIFQALFGGGKSDVTSLTGKPTLAEISEANTEYDNLVKNGGIPTPEQIKQRYFRNAPTDIKTNNAVYTTVKSIADNPDLPDEYKQAVLSASGLDPKDFEFYQVASSDSAERGLFLAQLTQDKDRTKVLTALVMAKREVGGKSIATSTDINYIYNMGLISKDEKSFLNAVNWDPIYNKFYMDRDYTGGGMTDAKRRAIINKLNTIFKLGTGLTKPSTTKLKTISLPAKKVSQKTDTTSSLKITPTKKAGAWFSA